MAYLLDTMVVSEARKRARADINVAAWLAVQDPLGLFVSVITILEIEIGIGLLDRRDALQASALRRWLEDQVLPTFDRRILPVSLDVARRCAAFHIPDPKPERDAMIAATAAVHGLVLVTRNVRDFSSIDVPILDPWRIGG